MFQCLSNREILVGCYDLDDRRSFNGALAPGAAWYREYRLGKFSNIFRVHWKFVLYCGVVKAGYMLIY